MSLQFLIDSFKDCPIIDKNGYKYFVHPLTDGAIPIDPSLLIMASHELLHLIRSKVNLDDVDYILAPEAMGLPIATTLGNRTGKPWLVIRKRKYGLDGELEVHQKTGYSESKMYINGVRPGNCVIIIDDVVSTGGTISAIGDILKVNNINLLGSFALFEKNSATKSNNDIHSLVNIITDKSGIREVTLSSQN